MLVSKFPKVGTTIFTVMSQAAAAHGAINLSQGFPDFDIDVQLADLCHQAMLEGQNQYAHMAGHPLLRQAIADKVALCYGLSINPDTEITVTSGATEAIFDALAALVCPGQEVIVLEPCYDCYIPAIELCGGVAVGVSLGPDFNVDWQKVKASITPRTRAIVVNSPHNPSGSVFSDQDIKELEVLAEQYNLLVISDEVYEHLVYDGNPHASVLESEALRQRSLAVYSFGKTYHATGWKIGYCLAPEPLMREFRKVHQYITFSTFTPAQIALATYLQQKEKYLDLSRFYQQKRDYFLSLTQDLPLRFLPCSGSYFVLADYSAVSQVGDCEFALWMSEKIGVATIPISPFYSKPTDPKIIRFCFAKKEQTLLQAAERLRRLLQ